MDPMRHLYPSSHSQGGFFGQVMYQVYPIPIAKVVHNPSETEVPVTAGFTHQLPCLKKIIPARDPKQCGEAKGDETN